MDELGFGFGWREEGKLERAGHALLAGGGVWLTDPFEAPGVEERVRALGEPAGIVQLLDRHARDCAAFARRLGVPLLEVPDEVPGFDVLPVVDRRGWREVALWQPEQRVLVCADALGTARYFRAGGERLAVHPILRLRPPRQLARLEPLHVLCGHGAGVHEGAAEALSEALATARRRLLRAWLGALRGSEAREQQ